MLSSLRFRVATATSSFTVCTRYWLFGGWLALLLCGLAAEGDAQIIYVTPTGAGNQRGDSWSSAKPGTDLREILATSPPTSATVLVAAGLYKPTTTTDQTSSFYIARGVELYGGYTAGTMTRTTNPSSTTLSGDIDNDNTLAGNVYHVVTTGSGNTVIDGLVITQGDARPLGAFITAGGGGLFAANGSPAIRSVHFVDNAARDGGGIFLNAVTSAMITNCLFSRNTATGGGAGGLYVNTTGTRSIVVTDCRFLANTADNGGGGVWNNGSNPSFTNCQFMNNTTSSSTNGGGLYNSSSTPSLTNCSFNGNTAANGGGMYNDGMVGISNPSLSNCSFTGNTATTGGGMCNANSSPSLSNCSFSGNTAGGNGGGMYNNGARGTSSPGLINCSFGGNTASAGGGMYNDASQTGISRPALTNCIIWANSSGVSNIGSDATPVYTYTDLQGGFQSSTPAFLGNRSVDPQFVGVAGGNLQLSACSPLIDAGDNGVNVPNMDAAGNPRRQRAIDFGAFEFQGTPATPVAITQQPASASAVCAGTTVTASVSTSGLVTGYQWYQNGTALSGQTSATLSLPNVTTAQSGSYSVIVTGSCTSVTSTAFSLTVAPQSPDYQPLADLYTSTNGSGWTNKTNWLASCDVCAWYGVTCTNGRVTGIDLTSNNLSGTLPASLSALTNLQSLLLGTNLLTGTIPASLGALPNLQTLILFQNSLTGPIPASLGNATSLQALNLSNNQLSGTIPDQLGALTQLRLFALNNNRLTGTLPASLSALTGAQAFDLSRNQLTGSIPAGYGALQNTILLNINNNQLSGCFPTSLSALCTYGPVVESIGTPRELPAGSAKAGARVSANGTNDKVNVTSNAGLPGGGDFDSFCASSSGSCNTAPVATSNVNQTATVGQAFSYTVNAFTDDTPASLTYTGAFNPANGLIFNPITRIISGTPTAAGVVSVTITATDPGGLSDGTRFTITVQPAPVVVVPLALTLTASPATLLTTGITTLSATVSGGTSAYRYTFAGPGTITPSNTTAQVTNLPTGVQTFTVVVSDATMPTSQTITKTVSVTVNAPAPVNTAPVATANPSQTATVGRAFSYTVSAFTDAETPGSLTYTASINPANGLTFNPLTRVLSGTPTATGTSGVTITATDPDGLSASTSFSVTATAAPLPAPVITTQPPAGSAVCAGTSVRASVGASGANLTYQWYRAGAIVSGQTSATLTLNTVTTGQAGSYQAVVSSGTSSVTSSAFSLTVNAVPAVSVSPSATAVCSPQTVTLSATPGLAAYRWNTGQTTASISVTVTGTYAVTAATASGCSNTATAQATINPRPDSPYATSIPRRMYTTNFPIPLILYALPTSFGLDLNFYNGATKTEIDPAVVQPNKAGVFAYYATQTDSKGCVSLPTPLSLTVLEGGTLATKPADRTVCQGATTVLSVTATGSNNRYTWYESSPSTPYAISEAGSNTKGGNTASLTVSKLQRSTLYYCLVIGQNGLDVAGPIKVTVNANCQGRLGTEEPEVPLSVRVLGNPLTGTAIELEVTGAENQPLRLELTDLSGRAVSERNLERAGVVERQTLSVGQQPSGLLLLRVSTPSQSQTVKVLKVE